MGAMGRYIAALSPMARDRLIVGQRWMAGELCDGAGSACLRGHAEGLAASPVDQWGLCDLRNRDDYVHPDYHDREAQKVHFHVMPEDHRHVINFNRAFRRWGSRTVRAIKLRAAKLNGTDSQTIGHLLEQRQEISA